jgi:hypothetical protein
MVMKHALVMLVAATLVSGLAAAYASSVSAKARTAASTAQPR